MLSISSCDLNDTDENGDFSLYFRTEMDGVPWEATATRATLDNNGADPFVYLEGDLSTSNEYFRITIPPMVALDTSITGPGLLGVIRLTRNLEVWYSTSGTLQVHDDHYVGGAGIKHEFTGTFSGTLLNASDNTTIIVTNGQFLVQGTF